MHIRTLLLAALVMVATGDVASAEPLAGSVSFDPNTGLYTYRYTLDNRGPPPAWPPGFVSAPISAFEVDAEGDGRDFTISTPPGWQWLTGGGLHTSSVGSSGDGLTTLVWSADHALPPGATLSGFSLTTASAPSDGGGGHNYVVDFPGSESRAGYTVTGTVVAPLLRGAPEPTALLLAALGALGLAACRARGTSPGQRLTPLAGLPR